MAVLERRGASWPAVAAIVLSAFAVYVAGIATLRRRDLLHGWADNPPILLMAGPEVLEGNLRHARVSRHELWSQLRLAGVHSRSQARAVIMETTGDMSVLRTGEEFDDELLQGVRGIEALR